MVLVQWEVLEAGQKSAGRRISLVRKTLSVLTSELEGWINSGWGCLRSLWSWGNGCGGWGRQQENQEHIVWLVWRWMAEARQAWDELRPGLLSWSKNPRRRVMEGRRWNCQLCEDQNHYPACRRNAAMICVRHDEVLIKKFVYEANEYKS